MAVSSTHGMLVVHSAPRALCPHLEWAIGAALGQPVSLQWIDQPAQQGCMRTEMSWEHDVGTGAAVASALRGWEHLRFEVTEDPTEWSDGGRWMHTPDLGIFYAPTNTAGDLVVTEDRLRAVMAKSGGNAIEMQREMRLLLGQAWDDELEPFRRVADTNPVIWLHRVG